MNNAQQALDDVLEVLFLQEERAKNRYLRVDRHMQMEEGEQQEAMALQGSEKN